MCLPKALGSSVVQHDFVCNLDAVPDIQHIRDLCDNCTIQIDTYHYHTIQECQNSILVAL